MDAPAVKRIAVVTKWPALLRWLPFVVLALAVLTVPIPTLVAPRTHHVELDSKQFDFAPGRLRVNQGDTVTLHLTASDVVHGFYLEGYDIDQRVEPGIPAEISFMADKRGKFRYRCSVSCGPLHPFMIGELIVGPNVPLWRAIGLAIVGLAALFASIHHKNTVQETTT